MNGIAFAAYHMSHAHGIYTCQLSDHKVMVGLMELICMRVDSNAHSVYGTEHQREQ